ncbi:unnamed protein product [Oncorhynchus mykiss]|uniref:Adrenomedullin n=1 Tax=Oncorhynchus mykiss TaxID=8022 RepID=A0A060XCW7_ONCMY|nr:unnamed protein product [Oncorhynchus mykiss]
MKVALQTTICLCVLATILPLVKGTKVGLNSNLKKRFRGWLPSRLRAALHSSSALDSGILSGPGQREETDSSVFNSRSRRSIVTSVKRPGCSLGTCTLQNLVHRLHILNNRLKVNRAPEDKISSQGYGRRRRRSPTALCFANSPSGEIEIGLEQREPLRNPSTGHPVQTNLSQAEKRSVNLLNARCFFWLAEILLRSYS